MDEKNLGRVVGTTYTPYVDADGNLSWTNNGGAANPPTVNVRGGQGVQGIEGEPGKQGEPGEQGPPGKDAYTESVAAGYIGTEDQFYADLADIGGTESTENRVTEITEVSTDDTYPTAEAVYKLFKSIPNANNISY